MKNRIATWLAPALRRSRLLLPGLILIVLPAMSHAGPRQHVPAGFDHYAVFMATGKIPFSSHPNPQITGCGLSIFCDGAYFHEVIMGRDAAEIAVEAQRAKDYFLSRFGVDVDALVAAGRMDFFSFYLDPRGDYRMYTLAGTRVPSRGWEVRDGGFAAMVTDPNGVELSGEFQGQGLVMPPEGLLVWGSYNVLATNARKKPITEIVIDYRSEMPMIGNNWGELVVNCQLSLDAFQDGELSGKAQGMGTVIPTSDFSGLRLNWRNVLTLGGLDLLE
ncbi:MAG: hypothetical protein KJO31_13190 [Gammaproteobacteria bacterium]|nr:hypothetical protein [Gammaproteobacteria bacterium]